MFSLPDKLCVVAYMYPIDETLSNSYRYLPQTNNTILIEDFITANRLDVLNYSLSDEEPIKRITV
jgi:hypothetical protein